MARRKPKHRSTFAGVAVSLFVSTAWAAPSAEAPAVEGTSRSFEPAALSWVRADGADACPGGSEIARAVEARLGTGALVPAANATLVVEAAIRSRADGGFHVDIALTHGNVVVGRRELESADLDCASIADQAALVIALTIDPEAPPQASARARPATPTKTQEPAPPPPAVPKTEPTAPAPVRPAAPWEGDLELAVGLATGTVPEVAPGLFLRGRVRPPRVGLALELESGYFPPRSVELTASEGAHFQLLFLGVAACTRPDRAAALRLFACAGPELAAITGSGYGFETSTQHFWSWTMALSARARLGFHATRGLSIVIGPNLTLPLGRDKFEALSPDAPPALLFQMKALGFGFELGAVWEL